MLHFCFRYWELGHAKEEREKSRKEVLRKTTFEGFEDDGLTTIKYTVDSVQEENTFTNYTVTLDLLIKEQRVKLLSH